MDWGEFIMGGIIGALIGVVGVFLSNLLTDIKGWRKVQKKFGESKTSSIEEQHEIIEKNLNKTILERTNSIEKAQNNEFLRIFNKVDNVDKEMVANKERYNNLNFDQKSIKDNVNKLVYDWESTNLENKELKGRITELGKKISELEIENKELITLLNKSRRRNKNMEL